MSLRRTDILPPRRYMPDGGVAACETGQLSCTFISGSRKDAPRTSLDKVPEDFTLFSQRVAGGVIVLRTTNCNAEEMPRRNLALRGCTRAAHVIVRGSWKLLKL